MVPAWVQFIERTVFSVVGHAAGADGLMAEVHNEKLRMPAVLCEEDHDGWLTGSPEQSPMQALEPYPSDSMEARKSAA